jgi:heptosyltransferase-2
LAKHLTREVTVAEAVGPVEHRVRHYLETVQGLGIEAYVARNFEAPSSGVARDPLAVVLAPDSDFGPSHEWALEQWLDLGRDLSGLGLSRLTVAGIAGGRGLGRALAAGLGEERAEWLEFRGLGDALPVLAACGLWVGVDSSLAHLAAHAGTHCVTLFGPDDPAWRRPLGRHHVVVRQHVECAPCLLAVCPLDLRCQKELTVREVFAAARGKLAEVRG